MGENTRVEIAPIRTGTNYDRLIEEIYAGNKNAIQSLVPFISDDDRVDRKIRDVSNVGYLKLHGCVTRTHDADLPLVLSVDQYVMHREKRKRLFSTLEEWGSEYTLVFIGHQLQDPNLRAILLDLTRTLSSRPRYYLVKPEITEVERDFWGEKRISVLDGSLQEFLIGLDSKVEKKTRALAPLIKPDHPISRWFVIPEKPSQPLLDFLKFDVEYVHEALPVENGDPGKFYGGFGLGWFPIVENLDVRRRLADQLIEDVILRPEEDRPSRVELYVVKAEAGAGKSVLLRRVAWDSATQADVLCLRHRGSSNLNLEAIKEIDSATSTRIFLFFDDAADHVGEIRSVLDFARTNGIRLTVLATERMNEWNTRCEQLRDLLSEEFQLRYLSESEISKLVDLLDSHNALGPNLTPKTRDERISEFVKRAGRQLLVALHEATLGSPFRDILVNEYEHVVPAEAQRLYLTVCVLNRLKVPVRAGLISRVHGIRFEDFHSRLFAPLEHVVLAKKLPWGDFGYEARHSEIAQIVFEEILTDSSDRFNEYIRVIGALNLMYGVDLEAFRGMVRGRVVHHLFPDHDAARAIFQKASEVAGEDAYLLQQKANYERIRPNGDLRLAESMLGKARQLNPNDMSIVHTLAEVYRARAEGATKPLERRRLRKEALAILQSIDAEPSGAQYAAGTKAKLAIDEARDLVACDETPNRDIDNAVRKADQIIKSALQRFPGDKHICLLEYEFAEMLRDDARSIEALEQARTANPRDPFIASRLASLMVGRDEFEKAKSYLDEALNSNPGDHRLNFQFAELLRLKGSASDVDFIYYYQRSFSKWDRNYESQFWFARFATVSRDKQTRREAREVFRHLRDTPMSHENRTQLRDVIGGLEAPSRFSGSVARVEAAHGFVEVDGSGESLFFHRNDTIDEAVWDDLRSGSRVKFEIGFTLRGPLAINVDLEHGDTI